MGNPIQRVALIAKPHVDKAAPMVRAVVRWLRRHGVEVLLEARVSELVRSRAPTFTLNRPPSHLDLMLVLGGDGTLLAGARSMGAHQVPILGVNLGSLGFLTAVALDELYPTLEEVLAGRFVVDERVMLDSELARRGTVVTRRAVLNDVVISKGAIARIIEIALEIDRVFVALIRADGIVASTPTGSTAYSLAAGGPILHPSLDAMILTPICPHTLSNRPVVIPDHARVELTLRGAAEEVFASFDGQAGERMEPGDVVRLSKSPHRVKLVRLADQNYFRVLRQKLRWAERPRSRGSRQM
jgi:NAD+ kinase